MRAVQLTAFGNPIDGLEYVDIPEPDAPGPDQVLIGVEFSPINPNDPWSHKASTHSAPRFQPSSAMKASAAFSPWGRGWRHQGRRPGPGAAFQLHLEGADGHIGGRPFQPAP